jgi:NAD(P)-dependent dehydrogenase (short-subunit alcohol dehydrogenase family)
VPELGRFPLFINRDRHGLAVELSRMLEEHGLNTVVTAEFPADARHVIYIGIADEHIAAEQVYDINYAAFAAARTIAANMEKHGGMFWTIQNTGGDFGLSGSSGNQAATAGLAALTKTAMKEWPSVHVKAIDVDLRVPLDEISNHICDELFRGGMEKEVGFMADGTRVTLELEAADHHQLQANAYSLAPYDTVLVSGGARGVTAQSLIALAGKQPLRFILLGRTELQKSGPNPGADIDAGAGINADRGNESEQQLTRRLSERALAEGRTISAEEVRRQAQELVASREIANTIDRLERLGSEVIYVPVDVTDHKALSAAIKPIIASWGPIRGIVHGAGVLADKRIADKRDEHFHQVFRTKVGGFQAMLKAADTGDLKLIVIFSSVAAREGNVGQCDYAMANEVLNKMAHQLYMSGKSDGTNMVVKALNWGPWEGGMVTPSLKRHFLSQGISLIGAAAGADCFAQEASSSNSAASEVEIVIGGNVSASPSFISEGRRTWKLEKVLELERHSWLDDHHIHGYRVVPIVAVLEWFGRFARSARSDLQLGRIENIRVLKGIRIHKDIASPVTLTAIGQMSEDAEKPHVYIDMQLADAEGTCHYAARAVMGRQSAEPDDCLFPWIETNLTLAERRSMPLTAWTLEHEWMYGRRLFHGPSFHVIDRLLLCNADYASGMLAKAEQPDKGRFSLSALSVLLDGGLQLARLWGYEQYKRPSLPMSIGGCRIATSEIGEEQVHCELLITQQNSQKFVADIVWADRHNRCVAQLKQVAMYFVEERQT